MTIKASIISFFILINLLSYSQRFEDIKDQEITSEILSEENAESLVKNVYTFIRDDLDSLDFEIFIDDGMLWNSLNHYFSQTDTVSYYELYNRLVEIKSAPFYPSLRLRKVLWNELNIRPADYANWEEDKKLIEKLGHDPSEIEAIRLYLLDNPGVYENYESLYAAYRAHRKEEEKKLDIWLKSMDEYNALMAAPPIFEETELLSRSKSEGKPILLFFTRHQSINGGKMEQTPLLKEDILTSLIQDFIFVPIYVDDQTELPEDKQEKIKVKGHVRQINSVGDKNLYHQMIKYKQKSQPYFVVLNSENEVLETGGQRLIDPDNFEAFLAKSLSNFI